MKCQYEKQGSRCYSPGACKDWGYCRQRNIDAGGMRNVTPEDYRHGYEISIEECYRAIDERIDE